MTNHTEIKQVYKLKFPGVIIGSKLWESAYLFLKTNTDTVIIQLSSLNKEPKEY